jgi:hypothetical protein
MKSYGITALRDLVDAEIRIWGIASRATLFQLAQAEATRDNDDRDRATLRALRFIDFNLARRVQRAAMTAMADAMTQARNVVAQARKDMTVRWQRFANSYGNRLLRLMPFDLAASPQQPTTTIDRKLDLNLVLAIWAANPL